MVVVIVFARLMWVLSQQSRWDFLETYFEPP